MLKLWRTRRSIAALEFGMLAPLYMIGMAATVDIGNAITANVIVAGSVQSASNYALVNASQVNSTSGATLATNLATIAANAFATNWANSTATVNNGPAASVTGGTTSSSGTPANANLCYCPTGTYSSITWGTSVTCGTTCTGGGIAGKFVVVTASYTWTPLFTSYSFVPSGYVSSGTVVQVQ
jgi:Flp pilus assembly protein TadG